MLENCKSLQEHWGGVSDIIDRWLEERREMLVKYCELSEISQFDGSNERHGHMVQSFCEVLVDYVSVGHFEVYEQLAKEGKAFDDQEGLKVGASLMSSIEATTEVVLDFNDKYLATDDLQSFAKDLSSLGETMAQRFEAEDQMIGVLHNAHLEKLSEKAD